MSILGEAQVRVGADMTTFSRDVTSGINKTAGSLSGLGGTIAKGLAIGTAAIAGLGAAAFANTERVGKMADSLFDLSAVTGASTDQLQEWRFVAAKTGQDTDFFGNAVKQLNRTMTQIENGTGKASDALGRLGVSVRDSNGAMKSSAQITNDAIVALSGLSDKSLRAQLATDIFSRKANELIPVLDEGAAGLEAMKQQAHGLGGVLSEDSLKAADHFRESLAVLHTQVTGVGNAVGANLAPVLDSIVQFVSSSVLPTVIKVSDAFGTWWTKMQDGPGIIANIKDSLGNMLNGDTITKVMGGIQSAIQTGVEGAAKWIDGGGLQSLVESFLSGKASFLKAGLDLIIALIGGIAQMLPSVIQFVVGDLLPAVVNTIVTAAPLILNAAIQLFTALVAGIATMIPILIPAAVTAALTIVTGIISVIPALIEAGVTAVLALVTGIVQTIPLVITAVTSALPGVLVAIIAILPKIITAGIQLIVGLVTGISQAIPLIVDALLAYWPVLVDTILGLITGLIPMVLDILPGLVDSIVTLIPMLILALADAIPKLIDGGIQLVLGLLTGIVSALPQILTAVIGAIPKIVTALINLIPQLIGAAIQLVLGLVTGIVRAIPQLVVAVVQAIPQIVMALIGAIPQLLAAGGQIIGGLWDGLVAAWPAIQAWFVALPGKVIGFLLTARTWLLEKGKDIIGGIIGGIVEKYVDVQTWFWSLPGKLLDVVKGAGSWLLDAGKNIIGGLWDGMKDNWNKVTSWVSGIGSWIKDHKGPKSYDLGLLVPAGNWIMEGLSAGLVAGLPGLKSTLNDITKNISLSPTLSPPAAGGTVTGTPGTASQGAAIGNISITVNVSGVASDYDAERAGRMAAQAALKELSAKARLR